jgi:hypothetical protein
MQVSTPTFGAELKRDGVIDGAPECQKSRQRKGTPLDLPRHRSADRLLILYLLVPTAA